MIPSLLKILLLAGLIQIMLRTHRPFLVAIVYTAIATVMMLAIAHPPLLTLLILGAIILATSSLYFWLLYRFSDNLPVFWVILILGLFIGLV